MHHPRYELFDTDTITGYVLDSIVGQVKYKYGKFEIHPRYEEDIVWSEAEDDGGWDAKVENCEACLEQGMDYW